jgi:hypothetical protein
VAAAHGEKLFEFGRCAAHFAVDDAEVAFLHASEGQGRGLAKIWHWITAVANTEQVGIVWRWAAPG